MLRFLLCALLMAVPAGCSTPGDFGDRLPRRGEEICAAGQLFVANTPVVLWNDPGGYDAYRTDKRFAPAFDAAWKPEPRGPETPNRYGHRAPPVPGIDPHGFAPTWDLDALRAVIDQVVIHYDACGVSRECFRILHDVRGLSAHFLIDLDGAIYQTLDLKERAWHATISNDRSIGIEMANIGAASPQNSAGIDAWYTADGDLRRIVLPSRLGDGGIRTPGFIARPSRAAPVSGRINGETLVMYDFTDEQYEALARLLTSLSAVFPSVLVDAPRDEDGTVLQRTLSAEELSGFQGILGHFHVQRNKNDPGPAFDWERVLGRVRRLQAASAPLP